MIGFLIINYNDAATTQALLDGIKNYACLDKIVVVDNHSTDSSFEILRKNQSEKVHIIQTSKNLGYSSGINFGLHYLESLKVRYSFISNSDVVISKEKDLKRIIERKDQGVLLAPVIREHTGYNRGWKVPTNFQLVLLSLPFIYRFFLKCNQYSDNFYQGKVLQVEAVSFCFFFVSIEALKKVDYFDEHVFLYYEENIMARKLRGQKILLCNDVEVFHNHSVTINKNLNRARKYMALSKSKRYFAKNYNRAGIVTLSCLWMIEKCTYVFLRIGNIFHH